MSTIEILKKEKQELKQELELYEFNGPSSKIQEIDDKLYEVNGSLKKLGVANV